MNGRCPAEGQTARLCEQLQPCPAEGQTAFRENHKTLQYQHIAYPLCVRCQTPELTGHVQLETRGAR